MAVYQKNRAPESIGQHLVSKKHFYFKMGLCHSSRCVEDDRDSETDRQLRVKPFVTPTVPVEGMTDEKAMTAYKNIESKWEASSSCTALKGTLREGFGNLNGPVTYCVLFGTGTMSGIPPSATIPSREVQEKAMYEVANFRISCRKYWYIACS